MRKETINAVTIYMVCGAVVNSFAVWLVSTLNISSLESLITVVAVNACFIVVARDVAKAH